MSHLHTKITFPLIYIKFNSFSSRPLHDKWSANSSWVKKERKKNNGQIYYILNHIEPTDDALKIEDEIKNKNDNFLHTAIDFNKVDISAANQKSTIFIQNYLML